MIRRLLTNRWFVGALGLLGLALVVFLLGPLFAFGDWRPLASLTARWIFMLLVVIVWLARRVLALMKARKAESEMVDGIVAAPVAEAADDNAEVGLLKQRFEDAIDVLRESKGKRGRVNLYELPWYLIIGPPGAGKTTALVNSGLNFPLAERFGRDAIQGIGGTRNCDWWFTDSSVIIDTAGRYTTQDSDAQADKQAWQGFLDLLKKYRKRRPINGIFVAISLADLLTQSEHERRDHISAIRRRIQELNEHFGISFPVYVLLTKTDLVAGFTEFFDDLGQGDREQVWGTTFAYEEGSATALGEFDREFDALMRRLQSRLVGRLAAEQDRGRRILIQGFPRQMESLKSVLGDFLGGVFGDSKLSAAPMLRGFYFTSGTQEGTPIDRLLGSLARTFRIDVAALSPQGSSGKSYFVTDVFKRVVFGETEIAGTNRSLERRRVWIKHASYAGIAAAVVLLVAGWALSYRAVRGDIDRARELVASADEALTTVSPRNLDPLSVVPPLDAVRALPGGYSDRELGTVPWRMGLSVSDTLGDVSVRTYDRLLDQLYLPRLQLRMERQLQRGGASQDYTYEALKAYLMLGSEEHYDADQVRAFLEFDWVNNLKREVSTEQRAALLGHLSALLEERPANLPLPLDAALIEQARREIRSLPLEYRIYGRLKRTVQADTPGFDIRTAAGGADADLVFVRKSGANLGEPLSPLFTRSAYQKYFVSESRRLTDEITEESWWITGETGQLETEDEQLLLSRVRTLYLDEFAAEYTNLVNDIDLAPFNSPDEAMRILNILSRPEGSPLLQLVQSISDETRLEEQSVDASVTSRVESGAAEALERIQGVLGTDRRVPDSVADALVQNVVEERFRALNRLVDGEEGQPKPIDRLLGLLRDLYTYMSTVASESAGGAIPPHVQAQGQAVTQQLKNEAASQPDLLVAAILATSADRSIALTTGGLRAYLNDLWQAGPLTTCRAAIESRYPIVVGSAQTIRLDDFGQFFGYGGTMDTFFNNHLRQYVDATRSPWRVRATGNTPIRLSGASLRAFEQADIIKRTFFRPGSMQPTVSFDLRPLEMDTSLSRFLLDLEGKIVTYEFGPKVPTYLQWPGPNPGSEVRVEMRDRQSGQTFMDRRQGPWAWFRLLDDSEFTSTSVPEQFEVAFSVGGRTTAFDLIARSAFNPFSLEALRRFGCPARL